MIDYTVLYKGELSATDDWPTGVAWDIFISGYTAAERVQRVFDKVTATSKHWLVFPEYEFSVESYPNGAFAGSTRDEAEYVKSFWSNSVGDVAGKNGCN